MITNNDESKTVLWKNKKVHVSQFISANKVHRLLSQNLRKKLYFYEACESTHYFIVLVDHVMPIILLEIKCIHL